MKICYVAPDVFIPYHSGASTHVIELAKALAGLGDEVHVICRRRAGQSRNELISGVSIHRVFRGVLGPLPHAKDSKATSDGLGEGRAARLYTIYLRTAFALYAGLEAARAIRSNGLEAVIERETAFGAGALAAIVTGRPMVLELIGPRYSLLSMETCYRLFAYNELMVPGAARPRATYVDAAVDTKIFHPSETARREVRDKLGFGDHILVGYVGTFQTWHGVQDLLKSAKAVCMTLPDARFVLVGPAGRRVKDLMRRLRLESQVILVDAVSYHDVPRYINACDILVAPYNTKGSEREIEGIGSPLKILEYMACGKAIIGSSYPQLTRLIEQGSNGLLFPPGDVKALSSDILQLAQDVSLRTRLGMQALEDVKEGYTWRGLAQQIRGALVEAIEA